MIPVSNPPSLTTNEAMTERELLKPPPPEPTPNSHTQPEKEVPTLGEFVERFLDGQARANRQKPSSIAAKERILRVHLVPHLGSRPLDTITNEDVQLLKHAMQSKAVKTVNPGISILPAPDGTFIHPRAADPTKLSSSHNRPAPEAVTSAPADAQPTGAPYFSGHSSDTAPHLWPFFARRAS